MHSAARHDSAHLDYVQDHFTQLRDCAVEEFCHYSSRWIVYSIDFLNCVAEIQGKSARIDEPAVTLHHSTRKRLCGRRVEQLLRQADSAGTMKVTEVIRLISAECSDLDPPEHKLYKELF